MWENWKIKHAQFHERMDLIGNLGGLRLWILYVLADGPKNGVEIMDAIQNRHNAIHSINVMNAIQKRQQAGLALHHDRPDRLDSWRPSPGSIYPMLNKMLAESLVIKKDDGRYELTVAGSETIGKVFGEAPPQLKGERIDHGTLAIENALSEIDGYVSYLEDIRKEKLASHEAKIVDLGDRLKKIQGSLQEK
jgi:DNA-binding PadR family transcriptional regulator